MGAEDGPRKLTRITRRLICCPESDRRQRLSRPPQDLDACRAKGGGAMKRVPPSDLSRYTRSDLIRSGIIAGVWGLFYILLVAYAGVRSNGPPNLAEAAAPASHA